MPAIPKDSSLIPITFFTKSEYYQDLIKRISQTSSGDRVSLTTMSFDPRVPEVNNLLKELYAAAKRGVNTSLAVDAYTFLLNHNKTPTSFWLTKNLPRRLSLVLQTRLNSLKELEACGGSYSILNKPGRRFGNPFAGRSHIKCAVINEYVYLGGCNLTTPKDIDLMIGIEDKNTANWLFELTNKIHRNSSTKFAMQNIDQEFQIDNKTTLLVDSGKSKQSVIFDTALKLIDHAQKSILITCQFFPNAITTKHLIKAHKRGVEVNVIYNRPGKHVPPYNVLHQFVVWREKLRTPGDLFKGQLSKKHPFIHAKLIATDQGAIIGSHNFISAGVIFGTAEIALIRRDPSFAKEAIACINHALEANKLA